MFAFVFVWARDEKRDEWADVSVPVLVSKSRQFQESVNHFVIVILKKIPTLISNDNYIECAYVWACAWVSVWLRRDGSWHFGCNFKIITGLLHQQNCSMNAKV